MSRLIERGSIVVGIDGSSHDESTLDRAIEQADGEKRPLTIVHAAGSPPITSVGSPAADTRRQLRIDGRRITDRALGYVREQSPDLRVDVLMKLGDPQALLVATSETASVVVVGSRGRGALASLLLGSVSAAVAARANCPVMVVRQPDQSPHHDGGHVVVGVDGSEISWGAVGFAFAQASLRRRPLTVVHVEWDPVEGVAPTGLLVDPDLVDAQEELLVSETLVGFAEKYPDVEVDVEVRRGDPTQVLVQASLRASLIVLGSRGRGRAKALLLGSTSRSVVEHAHCTVVVAR